MGADKLKLVIIGGVAAGASTAARARRLNENAEIVVLERGKHVSFANCGLPYHIGGVIAAREALLLQTPESLKASLNLDVRTRHEVIRINRDARTVTVRDLAAGREYDESYDKLVLAPGASPIRPNLPGIEHQMIMSLRNIDDMDAIKAKVDAGSKSAVVIGGGYIGVEVAENLRARGIEVELVELVDQILPPMDPEMVREAEACMRAHGIKLHLGEAAKGFRKVGSKIAVDLRSGNAINADFVVLSVGVKPDSSLAKMAGLEVGQRGGIRVNERMQTSDPDIYAAGDAVEVVDHVTGEFAAIALAGPANRQGRIVADNVMGGKSVYSSTQGTAIVKIFDMTVGSTGASEKTLKRLGRPYLKVYVHPSDHAGYFPGATQMHLKVLFEPKTGKLLGAQVAGSSGVDKRLDVLATALRAGLTVEDLKDLELAYAPPYGSAKDPVNMAGFVGENLLKGQIELWYAEDYPQKTAGGLLVDIRSQAEFEAWHIPGAVNIPLGKLRGKLGSIPKDKPLFLYCKVGFRSYLAYRVLKQSGFAPVSTLAGGSLTFKHVHPDVNDYGSEPAPVQPPVPAETKPPEPAVQNSGRIITVDCCGMQCPGPIAKMKEAIDAAVAGDEIVVCATDGGFASDASAWCRRNGHEILEMKDRGGRTEVHIRKGSAVAAAAFLQAAQQGQDLSLVVFSGELDKVLAAFVIANGALSMGSKVTMFFTFWGLNALRRDAGQAKGKGMLDMMFGAMMPKGPNKLKLSNMNMMGAGTAMMKHVMKSKNVASLPELVASARKGGARIVVCTMSMDVMGLKKEELMENLEFGGVATFLEAAGKSGTTLFI